MQIPEAQQDTSDSKKHFHIFGNGIAFSISPTIHNAGFKYHDLPYTYDIRESANIDGAAHLIEDDSFGGGSVTMPHKLQVHKYCQRQTETAKVIGAINTLIVSGQGQDRIITGDNTDWSGLYNIMAMHADRCGGPLKSGLVIGAGGASRAALYAMHRAGVQRIFITNRTQATATAIKEAFSHIFEITVLPTLKDLPAEVDVIIGTIPADVTSEKDYEGVFGPRGLCIDMSYKPRQTPLLLAAKKHQGWDIITGIQVLLSQAFDQYKLWTGKDAPRKAILDAVTSHEAGEKIEIEGKL